MTANINIHHFVIYITREILIPQIFRVLHLFISFSGYIKMMINNNNNNNNNNN